MRKRSKYRPKGVRLDTLGYVMESLKPVAMHESYLLDLKIKNSEAMVALISLGCMAAITLHLISRGGK